MVYNAPYGNAAYCYFDYQSYGTLRTSHERHARRRQRSTDCRSRQPAGYGGIVYASTTVTTNPEWLTCNGTARTYTSSSPTAPAT